MPAYPAYFLLAAALPLLVPGVARRIPERLLPGRPGAIPRRVLAGAGVGFVVLPLLVISARSAALPRAAGGDHDRLDPDAGRPVDRGRRPGGRSPPDAHVDASGLRRDEGLLPRLPHRRGRARLRLPGRGLARLPARDAAARRRRARHVFSDVSPPANALYRVGVATNWAERRRGRRRDRAEPAARRDPVRPRSTALEAGGLLGLLLAAAALFARSLELGASYDEGVYLASAEALARGGRARRGRLRFAAARFLRSRPARAALPRRLPRRSALGLPRPGGGRRRRGLGARPRARRPDGRVPRGSRTADRTGLRGGVRSGRGRHSLDRTGARRACAARVGAPARARTARRRLRERGSRRRSPSSSSPRRRSWPQSAYSLDSAPNGGS